MPQRFVVSTIVLAVLMSGVGQKPAADPQHVDGWYRPMPDPPRDQKAGPAPVHDLSGIWEPAAGWHSGTQALGAQEYPLEGIYGKHINIEPPFTPLGEQAYKANKAGQGAKSHPPTEVNDPFEICDPMGFPRVDLFQLRALQIAQTKKEVVIFYQAEKVWRSIWMDGRELPKKFPEPRWYGYSVGKWVDDTTFVAQTAGLDERTWLDNVGRPHSSDLVVEERFHRVNQDILELTVTINDPKMYTKPWVALNKFPLRLQEDNYDIREQICSASEAADYIKATRAVGAGSTK